jgi:hypothetical protein
MRGVFIVLGIWLTVTAVADQLPSETAVTWQDCQLKLAKKILKGSKRWGTLDLEPSYDWRYDLGCTRYTFRAHQKNKTSDTYRVELLANWNAPKCEVYYDQDWIKPLRIYDDAGHPVLNVELEFRYTFNPNRRWKVRYAEID